ncbi:MAG: phosphoribosylamine--glycine ligase [Cellvibrionaceae bacterium]
MNILVVGNGGREHAIAWKCAQSDRVENVFLAPGNAGTASDNKLTNVPLSTMDFEGLAKFAKEKNIGLTIIGPEAPLVDGIVDYFQEKNLPCFGPTKGAAQLEGSKAFTKDFLARHNIPTGYYKSFTEVDPAITYIEEQGAPIVVKADGLAAGKGVIVAMNVEEAKEAVIDMLSGNSFGEAGCRVVIEEFLDGEEASFIVIADGKHILPMATSQDHKRVGNGDTGLNTGGMGAYSPAPVVTDEVYERVMNEVIVPTIEGMAKEGNSFTGFLYAGLMIAKDGTPKVIEYNCRMGDPETQPILMRLKSDLVEICEAALEGALNEMVSDWDPRPAVGIVLAAGGYPGDYKKGDVISGLPENESAGEKVFHAGTSLKDGKVVTNGGRILCTTAMAPTITEAQQRAYDLANKISWDGCYKRDDIAYRAIERESV